MREQTPLDFFFSSRMSINGKARLVKFLCVDVKSGETQENLKLKVLKAILASEKKSATIAHPLQSWTEEAHSFPELQAEQVLKVVANSSHVAFLLRDGRVCRIRVASWEESASSKTLSLDALRQPQQKSSFQVLGDAEYARQLQAELNSDLSTWARGDFRRPSLPFGSMYRNMEDLMQNGVSLQGLDVPGGTVGTVPSYVVVDDNAMASGWR